MKSRCLPLYDHFRSCLPLLDHFMSETISFYSISPSIFSISETISKLVVFLSKLILNVEWFLIFNYFNHVSNISHFFLSLPCQRLLEHVCMSMNRTVRVLPGKDLFIWYLRYRTWINPHLLQLLPLPPQFHTTFCLTDLKMSSRSMWGMWPQVVCTSFLPTCLSWPTTLLSPHLPAASTCRTRSEHPPVKQFLGMWFTPRAMYDLKKHFSLHLISH